ncbi:DNA polymerase III epsilon subunit-like protein [Streptomyces ambofaciens]
MSWHLKRMAAFDLETTAADPEQARIVTACVVQVGGGQPPQPATWVADPGVDIPDEAANIHGYTTERARAEGRPAAEVVEEITAALGQVLAHGIPIVAMNARYDLTVLDRECRRHGLETLLDRYVDSMIWPVIDPFVIDKHVDRYRRGSRTLTALCEHYKVKLDGAHDSAADAIAAAPGGVAAGGDPAGAGRDGYRGAAPRSDRLGPGAGGGAAGVLREDAWQGALDGHGAPGVAADPGAACGR